MKTKRVQSPAELRKMFGANLRLLAASYPSISELARQLGINRTQFNRYISGESCPRPDVLARICDFFDVDARVILEPLEGLQSAPGFLAGEDLEDFLQPGMRNIPEEYFASGFYRFSRRSFCDGRRMLTGLVYVYRKGENTLVRGYEPKQALIQLGVPTEPSVREFRGLIMRQDDGIAALISRRGSKTCSFNYVERIGPFTNNSHWEGFVSRTARESLSRNRVTRVVFECIGRDLSKALATARNSGFTDEDGLDPFHRRLLRLEEPLR